MADRLPAAFSPLFVAELVLERLQPCGDALRKYPELQGPYYQVHRLEGCLHDTVERLRSASPTLSGEGGACMANSQASLPRLFVLMSRKRDQLA